MDLRTFLLERPETRTVRRRNISTSCTASLAGRICWRCSADQSENGGCKAELRRHRGCVGRGRSLAWVSVAVAAGLAQ